MLIRHKLYPQLIGEIKKEANGLFGVEWKEPWLAATILDSLSDLFWLNRNEYEEIPEDEFLSHLTKTKKTKNITCPVCLGKGVEKVINRRELLMIGPYKECYKCKGSGKIRNGVD